MLPWERRARYKQEFVMKDEDAEMFVQNEMFRDFFEGVASLLDSEKVKLAVNYITSDIAGLIKKAGIEEFKISPIFFAEIISMISAGDLSSRGAKDLLAIYWNETVEKNPKLIAEERGMIQKNDPEALKKLIQELIDQNPTVVADYKAGKQASLQFFIGQIMKVTKGSVNPQIARDTLLQIIDTQA